MKDYIETLIELINYEREEEISQTINEIRNTTALEREQRGRAINKVKGKFIKKELDLNIVQYGRQKPINTEISVGDIVLISTDNPLKSTLTATVTQKANKYLQLGFSSKVPKWALKKKVRLDLYVNDITYRRMEDNLKNLSIHGKNALEYLLGINDAKYKDNNIYLEYIDQKLNTSQKESVKKCLQTKDFYLIHGPFGTGKTRTLIELIQQEIRHNHKVLSTAESNAAIDNILDRLKDNDKLNITRLGHPHRVLEDNIKYTLAYKSEKHEENNKIKRIHKEINELIENRKEYTKPSPRYRRGLKDNDIIYLATKNKSSRGVNANTIKSMAKWLEYNTQINKKYDKIKKIEDKIIKEIIDDSDVILSTNSSAALEYIRNTKFDVAIIDEASQTTIPSILIPISKAHRFILAGDHKQLPPTILSPKAQKLEETLFETLISKYPYKSRILNVQYRMNKELMEFPNSTFYNNKLKTDESIEDINLHDFIDIDDDKLFTFIDTSQIADKYEEHLNDSKSLINRSECNISLNIAQRYVDKGINKKDIGIIAPYSDQAKLITQQCDIEAKTVDAFQGREKEIIIISTVRSNKEGKIGFLNDLRRLNVAITRAKRKLIIIGDKDTLQNEATYKKLIEYAAKNNSIINAKNYNTFS